MKTNKLAGSICALLLTALGASSAFAQSSTASILFTRTLYRAVDGTHGSQLYRIKPSGSDLALLMPVTYGTDITKTCTGAPNEGTEFALGFGPGYDWRARVTKCRPNTEFELQLVDADPDWTGTRVRFQLESTNGSTQLRFAHIGWPTANEHWRISCYCWPIYLRLLRRWLEYGEVVPYERRLSV